MLSFEWERNLYLLANPNAQVKLLNETILNIMKNFIPSSNITSKINVPEWINKDIRRMLKKQKSLHKKYRLNGFKDEDKLEVDRKRNE